MKALHECRVYPFLRQGVDPAGRGDHATRLAYGPVRITDPLSIV